MFLEMLSRLSSIVPWLMRCAKPGVAPAGNIPASAPIPQEVAVTI